MSFVCMSVHHNASITCTYTLGCDRRETSSENAVDAVWRYITSQIYLRDDYHFGGWVCSVRCTRQTHKTGIFATNLCLALIVY